MAWEKKHDSWKYTLYKDALTNDLEKVGKYYSCLDEKPSFVLALSKLLNLTFKHILIHYFKCFIPIISSPILNMHGVALKNKQPKLKQEILMQRTGKTRQKR